jgi:hypothetical protein
VLPPVTFTQFAALVTPVPRLNPIQALPSFVPAIATLLNFGEYFTWLMKERFPSDCLVMFWVEGLLVTTQVLVVVAPVVVSQTRVVPAIRLPHPVVAPAGPQSSPPGMPP